MKRKYFSSNLLIFLYLLAGIYLSLNTGFSHDEHHEQLNWIYNFEAYKSIFGFGDYDKLLDYQDKYHGVAFQFISQPFQNLTSNLIYNLLGTTEHASHLLSKHIVIFFIFFVSGIYFYKICLLISSSNNFALLSTSLYLTFPYLFGHSLINPKDIPFLSIWLISSFYFFEILKTLYLEKKILLKQVIILSILTSFLISIRVVGLLIFFQFMTGLLVLSNFKNISLLKILKINYKNVIYYFLIFILLLYIFNPIFWLNPLELINSIKYMSKYYNDVCTLTLGKCEKSTNLPASYYFVWLFFKLPIISFLGIILFPFVEKKILDKSFAKLILFSLIITVLSIILFFIFKKVAIYDEIRHILFILPLILLASFYCLYIFKKEFFYIFASITVIFFLIDNYRLFPYQYTWMNEFSRGYNISNNFEVDYWGTSNKKLQLKILELFNSNKISNEICVYGDGFVSAYLKRKNFNCFGYYNEIDFVKKKPFIAYQNLRNLKRNSPNECDLIYEDGYKYLFSKEKIITGKLWYCS